jgi:glucokinase
MTVLRAGIDLGGTKIQVVVLDESNEVKGQCRVPTPRDKGPQGVIDTMVDAVKFAISDAAIPNAQLVGVGVGGPGQIDPVAGTLSGAPNLPDWLGSVQVVEPMRQSLGAPVLLANDVQVAVIAEDQLGAGRDYSSVLGVFCGTGVGGGIIINGKLWKGRGAAGEIGHIVVEPNGAMCGCGRRGCMEAYAGRASMERKARKMVDDGAKTSLFKIMKEKEKANLSSSVWDKALRQNDKVAEQLMDRAVWALGIGVASAFNLLDPECVVIGGGLGSRLGQPFVDSIIEAMQPHLLKVKTPPAITLAALGDLGGAIGATLLLDGNN